MAELGSCPSAIDGIGNGGCIKAPLLKMASKICLSLESQSFASLDAFKDEDEWKAAIAAKTIFPLGEIHEIEDVSTEEVAPETSSGTKVFIRDGKYGMIFSMLLTPDQNRILQSYKNKNFNAYIIDNQNTNLGTSTDGTSVKGLSLSYINVKPIGLPMSSDGIQYSRVEIQFEYPSEINLTPRYAIGSELDWYPLRTIKPMTKITVTPGTVTSYAFTCAFSYDDPTTGKSIPFSSVETTDVVVKDQNGDAVTVTIVETDTEGTFTITDTGAGMTSGSITMVASADSLYYSETVEVEAA